jgi:transketolase
MTITELERTSRTLRLNVIKMIGVGHKGHLGGSCSLAEIVAVLYFHKMRHDPGNPLWEERDRFLLSEGHAAFIQYAGLAEHMV